jgi:hypothetical protein
MTYVVETGIHTVRGDIYTPPYGVYMLVCMHLVSAGGVAN